MEERRRRVDEAGTTPETPASHKEYWTLKRAIWNLILVGFIIGPVVILGITSIAVVLYILIAMPPTP